VGADLGSESGVWLAGLWVLGLDGGLGFGDRFGVGLE